MTRVEQKVNILKRIYAVYDEFVEPLTVSCDKGCASCCTCNVTLTSLEGYLIADDLRKTGQADIIERLQELTAKPRFQPKITTNGLAALCVRGENPPDEVSDPSWGRCPFLDQEVCTHYRWRPFACRCLLSQVKCENRGHAEVPSFVLTVNTVFMQVIEHVDRDGMTGNLIDMVPRLQAPAHYRAYAAGIPTWKAAWMIPNQPLTCLMVPPEHRERIKGILAALQAISI